MIKSDLLNNIKNKKNLSKDILFRLGRNIDFLYDQYYKIYKDVENSDEYFEKLIDKVIELYSDRSAELKKIDDEREKNPFWYMSNEIVGTMLYVQRYNKDLNGMLKKIDHLKDLGINYVHLMPLLDMPDNNNDGGYAVRDFKKVSKEVGDIKDLKKITKIFRKNNMLIELDIVMNHVSDQHKWAIEAKKGNEKYQKYFYFYDDFDIPSEYEKGMLEVFPEVAPGNFTYVDDLNKWVMTRFYSYQWDLNYTNPEILIEMIDIIGFISNLGIDILRLDAVPFLWKKIGTICMNEEEAHIIVRLLKSCMNIIAPGVLFKAEAIVEPKEIVRYLGESKYNECEIAYNATFMVLLWDTIATGNIKLLREGLSSIPRLPKGTTWINYIRSHDDIGLGYDDNDIYKVGYTPKEHRKFIIDFFTGKFNDSFSKGITFMENLKTGDARISGSMASLVGLEKGILDKNEKLIDESINRIKMLHTIIMSIGGIPLVYYGNEVGYLNDYSYIDDEHISNDNRWIHRPNINWEIINKKDIKGTPENIIYSNLKKVINKRKNQKAFSNENDFEILDYNNDYVFSFLKQNEDSKVVVVTNFSNFNQRIHKNIFNALSSDSDNLYDYLNDEKIIINDDFINIEPYKSLWVIERRV